MARRSRRRMQVGKNACPRGSGSGNRISGNGISAASMAKIDPAGCQYRPMQVLP